MTFILFSNCSNITNNKKDIYSVYGMEFNNEREKIGLSLLKDDWIHLPINEYDNVWWYNPSVDSVKIITKAYYSRKVQKFRQDTLISEIDIFSSPEIYYSGYDFESKRLSYIYYFVPNEEFETGWKYFYQTNPDSELYWYISKQEADSILSSWGIRYPFTCEILSDRDS